MTPKSLIEPARHAGTALLRSQTDARLVDLTRDGNERAFEAIVQRYRRPLLRYCSRLLTPTRAEDAVQQAFLSAHRAIHAGDAELNLRPWLYRIAHNASLNLLRQSGFDHDQVSEEIDGVETPPQAFERGERLRTVVAAVRDLPERQRSAIVLQAVDGRSYEEIAAELGVSDGAVRQLLNRARTTLREAAAALTPTGLLTRIGSSGGEATVVGRVTAALAGAGGGALVAKAGAALVVAGAVAGGAAVGGLPGAAGGGGNRDGRAGSSGVAAAVAPGGDAAARGGTAGQPDVDFVGNRGGGGSGGSGAGGSGSGKGGAGSQADDRGGRHAGDDRGGRHGGDDRGEHGGGGPGSESGDGERDDHGGRDGGDDDRSGPGTGDGHSGSGGGDSPESDDNSGSGGSGSSGSGKGGSDDDPPEPDDSPDSSGSGSSGSSGSGSGGGDPIANTSADDPPERDRSGKGGGSDDDPLEPPDDH